MNIVPTLNPDKNWCRVKDIHEHTVEAHDNPMTMSREERDHCTASGMTRVREFLQSGKIATTIVYPDGRQDVDVQVSRLDVKETDEATLKAKAAIEGAMPEIAEKMQDAVENTLVRVVVIHKPTLESVSHNVTLPAVRQWAEQAIEYHMNEALKGDNRYSKSDYAIVEVFHNTYATRVSSLEKL